MRLVVSCPVDGLVIEKCLLHEMSKRMAFAFHFYLQGPFRPFQYIDLQLGPGTSDSKSSANRRLSTFLQTLQRSILPDRTSSFPHREQYALITPRSFPTVVSLGIRWLVSMTFARMMSFGLTTSPITRSKRGLELEM